MEYFRTTLCLYD